LQTDKTSAQHPDTTSYQNFPFILCNFISRVNRCLLNNITTTAKKCPLERGNTRRRCRFGLPKKLDEGMRLHPKGDKQADLYYDKGEKHLFGMDETTAHASRFTFLLYQL
jgi:hypothetical protein